MQHDRRFKILFLALLGAATLCLVCLAGAQGANLLGLFPLQAAARLVAPYTVEIPWREVSTNPTVTAAFPALSTTPLAAATLPDATTPTASAASPLDIFTPTTAAPPKLISDISAAACIPPQASQQVGMVTRVVDGDTIEAQIDGLIYRIRYIGIDAPESGSGAEPSTSGNRALVEGKTVILFKDISETDRYDRLLRYVFVGNIFINDELLRQGLAEAVSYPPDTACYLSFLLAQESAQRMALGMWALLPPARISPIASPSPSFTGNCDPAYPDACIPPPPPDLDCRDISPRRFRVLPPDPHNFDGDHDGIGCES